MERRGRDSWSYNTSMERLGDVTVKWDETEVKERCKGKESHVRVRWRGGEEEVRR